MNDDRDLTHFAKKDLSYAEQRTFTPETCIEYCREKEWLIESKEKISKRVLNYHENILTIFRVINTQVHSIMVHVSVETSTENMDKRTKLTVIPPVWQPLTKFVGVMAITQFTEHQVRNYRL